MWSDRTPYGQGQPWPTPNFPAYRSALDSQRAGKIPDADYPYGYLGTFRTRREDRPRPARRANAKSYRRGIHRGERIDQRSYFWPEWFQPSDGLRAVAAGVKQVPRFEHEPEVLGTRDKFRPGTPIIQPAIHPLQSDLPPWR